EVDSGRQFREATRKLGSLLEQSGDSHPKISQALWFFHANSWSFDAGGKAGDIRPADTFLTRLDRDAYVAFGSLMEPGGSLHLGACSSFRGGELGSNIGCAVSDSMPHVTVVGSRIVCSTEAFIFSDQFEPVVLDYTHPNSKIVFRDSRMLGN